MGETAASALIILEAQGKATSKVGLKTVVPSSVNHRPPGLTSPVELVRKKANSWAPSQNLHFWGVEL